MPWTAHCGNETEKLGWFEEEGGGWMRLELWLEAGHML